jgi:hypothetical protein
MPSLIDVIFRRVEDAPEIPECPDHKRQMRLRGKQGKPTRFFEQSESEYTLIYFCPEDGCNATDTRVKVRTQVPVPGESPTRPAFARPGEDRSL